jgi:hypothetical protein
MQDSSVQGNIIEALQKFQNNFGVFDQVICIGSDRIMKAVSIANPFKF